MSIKIIDKKIKNLTNEEKEKKIIEDIEIEDTKISKMGKNSKIMSDNINKQKISKYADIQESVYQIIRKEFKHYKIFEEVRIDKQML